MTGNKMIKVTPGVLITWVNKISVTCGKGHGSASLRDLFDLLN